MDNMTETDSTPTRIRRRRIDRSTGWNSRAPIPTPRRRTGASEYRAANTELTIANARISELNRMRAEEVLRKRLADPADAWTFGGDLNAMLNDVGMVDDDAVLAFAEDLCAAKPYLAAKMRPVGARHRDDIRRSIPTPGSGAQRGRRSSRAAKPDRIYCAATESARGYLLQARRPGRHTGSQHAAGHIDITSVARGRWVCRRANTGALSDPTAAQ